MGMQTFSSVYFNALAAPRGSWETEIRGVGRLCMLVWAEFQSLPSRFVGFSRQ